MARKKTVIDEAPAPTAEPLPIDVPKGWARASETLDLVTAVPTLFAGFNRATKCGGLPVRRIHTVHGPSAGGKSIFCLGLIRSFLEQGHCAALIDAEHATEQRFAHSVVLRSDYPTSRPNTYEEAIDAVDSFLDHVVDKRKANPDLCCVVVVDTINKLTPARQLKNILSDGGEELSKGHGGRYRAAVNQAWLDHLVPRLSAANCALVLVAQEREDEQTFGRGEHVQIKGGKALVYDASLLIRISKSSPIFEPPSDKTNVVGFAHRLKIYKSKVGSLDGFHTDAAFFVSNGRSGPTGLDVARDYLSVGKAVGVVNESASWLSWGGKRWQGMSRAAAALGADPQLLAKLCSEVELAQRTT